MLHLFANLCNIIQLKNAYLISADRHIIMEGTFPIKSIDNRGIFLSDYRPRCCFAETKQNHKAEKHAKATINSPSLILNEKYY